MPDLESEALNALLLLPHEEQKKAFAYIRLLVEQHKQIQHLTVSTPSTNESVAVE